MGAAVGHHHGLTLTIYLLLYVHYNHNLLEAYCRSWHPLACSDRAEQGLASSSHDDADQAGPVQGYLMQILSVKLGVATGLNMAQQCR